MKVLPGVLSGTLVLLFVAIRPIAAEEWVKYAASPSGSSVKVEGTSTFHDWIMESKIIGGALELDPKVKMDPAEPAVAGLDGNKVPIKAKISIPVRSLKSHATAMDNVCQDAMEVAKFPRIEFQLEELTPKAGNHKPGTPFEFNSTGKLAVHGVTSKITMPVTIEPVGDNKLRIKGSTSLKMTSFGVKPPSPSVSLGLIKTGDQVKVSFDWLVVKKAEATATTARK